MPNVRPGLDAAANEASSPGQIGTEADEANAGDSESQATVWLESHHRETS